MADDSVHSDVNQFDPGAIPQLRNEAAINQSLINLLSTRKYQRLFNNEFGIDLEGELFEPADDITALEVLRIITLRVEQFEPRVQLDFAQTTVVPDPDNNQFIVTLKFRIRGQEENGLQELKGVVSQ